MQLLRDVLGIKEDTLGSPSGSAPINFSSAEKMEFVHKLLDCLDDDPRSCAAMERYTSGMNSKQCVDLVLDLCRPCQLVLPPTGALLDLAKECGDVTGAHVDALSDDEFVSFVRRVLLMALHVLDHDVARGWIERLHVEEPNAATLVELQRLLHTRRAHRLRWVELFVTQHGVDALCVWLQRLQARTGHRGGVLAASRLEGMERLLQCLYELMNGEAGSAPPPPRIE